jgi:hypothetical protein
LDHLKDEGEDDLVTEKIDEVEICNALRALVMTNDGFEGEHAIDLVANI